MRGIKRSIIEDYVDDSFNWDAIIPTQAEIDKIVRRQIKYEQALKNKASVPFDIANPFIMTNQIKNKEKALKYLIIAILIQWVDLKTALLAKLKKDGITKAEVNTIKQVILNNNLDLVSKTNKVLKAIEDNSLREAIEKHETLNPKLWNDDNTLKTEVHDKIKEIVAEFCSGLEEDSIKINVKDIVLIGSNASYNYTKNSDIDLHIRVDMSTVDNKDKIYDNLYSAYRTIFNKKFDIDFYDIPVELYVEDEDAITVSNGIYSVQNQRWLKEPVNEDIPEYDKKIVKDGFEKYKKEYKELTNKKIEKITPEEIDCLINEVYAERKRGIAISEYSEYNLIFKEFRNAGYLDKLKELKNKAISYQLSLKEDLLEVLLNKEYYDIKNEMSRIAHNQVTIDTRNNFHIYNVKQNDVPRIMRQLKQLSYVKEIHSIEGRFDFSNPPILPGKLPDKFYTIAGKIEKNED